METYQRNDETQLQLPLIFSESEKQTISHQTKLVPSLESSPRDEKLRWFLTYFVAILLGVSLIGSLIVFFYTRNPYVLFIPQIPAFLLRPILKYVFQTERSQLPILLKIRKRPSRKL